MAFEVGENDAKIKPSINVAPLVDVVLVLLIIFMVITPLMNKQLSVNVPMKDDQEATPPPADDEDKQVILSVHADGSAFVNTEKVADDELEGKLQRVFAVRQDHTLFFDASGSLDYGRAMDVLDIARGSGIKTIAVLTEAVVD
jgi:biopolymer transport protein ExbD